MWFWKFERATAMKPSIIVAAIFLLIVSAVHLLRLIFQIKVTMADAVIPMWMSAAACVATAVLAIWLWRENRT
jgi:hypothetical protein